MHTTIVKRKGSNVDGRSARRFGGIAILAMLCLATSHSGAWGQMPDVAQLLPENTVAFISVSDMSDLFSQLGETAMGRMLKDPEVEPFVTELYDSAAEAFRGIEDELGLSIEQLRDIPQGKSCLALVAPENGSPLFVALIGAGDQLENARRVVDYVQAKMVDSGNTESTEKVGNTELTILTRTVASNSPDLDPPDAEQDQRVTVFFERDGTICITPNVDLAKEILAVWGGTANAKTLADNPSYATIMERCVPDNNQPPQLTYYLDPIGIVRSIASQNMAVQMVLGMLSQNGLDGLRGVGGSLLLGSKDFESVHHLHILVDSPRTGVLEMLAPATGDVTPEVWAPNDVSSYMTLHWDIQKSYSALADTFKRVRGPQAWDQIVANSFVGQLGLDMQRDIVDKLDGRITRISWTSDPSAARRAHTLTGLKLKDAGAFRRTLDRVANGKARSQFTRKTESGFDYYEYQKPRSMQSPVAAARGISPKSYIGILGDYLLLVDDEELMKRAIDTKRGALSPLGDELDFKVNASKISLLPGGKTPVMISFSRPEVALRSTYLMLQSENTHNNLAQLTDQNRLFGAVDKALRDHPLPPFHVLAKYFAFSGRLVTNDDTGIHSLGFTFRRNQP